MDGQVLLAVLPQDTLSPRETSEVPWGRDFEVGQGKPSRGFAQQGSLTRAEDLSAQPARAFAYALDDSCILGT